MIRLANKFDNEAIKNLLVDFHRKIPNDLSKDITKWDFDLIDKQLLNIYAGMGFVLIDEDYKGFLCAVKTPCFWIPKVYTLQETMWHGKSKKVAYSLLKEYIKIGKKMKQNNEITEFYFSSFQDGNFEKLGAKKTSFQWVI